VADPFAGRISWDSFLLYKKLEPLTAESLAELRRIEKLSVVGMSEADLFFRHSTVGRDDAETEQRPEQLASRVAIPDLQGEIRFDGVYFRYGGNETPYVLENISLDIKPGELVAIVGRSGSGKTTLAKLLVGFYPPTEGKLIVDGFDMNVIDKEYYRAQVGYVMQTNLLFSGTIAENIATGSDGPDRRRIEAAIIRLRGLFIKVGQLISIMANFLPDAFREELRGLQDQVPPRPYEDIEATRPFRRSEALGVGVDFLRLLCSFRAIKGFDLTRQLKRAVGSLVDHRVWWSQSGALYLLALLDVPNLEIRIDRP